MTMFSFIGIESATIPSGSVANPARTIPGVAIAAFGALNGWTLVQSQIPYDIARDGLFPRWFARTNSRGVPYMGLSVNGTIMSILIGMNYTSALVEQFRFLRQPYSTDLSC